MSRANLRILIAGELSSSHLRRWCMQLVNTGWDIHLLHTGQSLSFPSAWYKGFTVHSPYILPSAAAHRFGLPSHWYNLPRITPKGLVSRALHVLQCLPHSLALILLTLQPHVIHSHGLNVNWRNNLLPVYKVLSRLPSILRPNWLYSTWGADLDFFPHLGSDHEAGVRRVLPLVDALVTECERDRRLAREFGFNGSFLGKIPMFGGVSEQVLAKGVRPMAERRLLLIKGRDAAPPDGDPVGRAGVIFDALESCLHQLGGWRVVVLQATPSIRERVARLAATGLDISAPAYLPDYDAVLTLFAQARAFIAMTVNDGLPSSLVESMALGALPIHSDLEPIAEWVTHGTNGLLTGAEDVQAIVETIDRAINDVPFVEAAAAHNRELVRMHLDADLVRTKMIDTYIQVASLHRHSKGQ